MSRPMIRGDEDQEPARAATPPGGSTPKPVVKPQPPTVKTTMKAAVSAVVATTAAKQPAKPGSPTATSPRKKAVSVLECPVCVEPFHPTREERMPRLLFCGHSVCGECLARLTKNGDSVVCPFDRQLTPMKGDDIKQMKPTTAFVKAIPQLIAQQNMFSETKIDSVHAMLYPKLLCGVCKQDVATVFCSSCNETICQEFCSKCAENEHSSTLSSRHKRVPINERPAKEPKCKQHGERIKHFCSQCQTSICGECRDASHNGHPIRPIVQASTDVNGVLTKRLEELRGEAKSLEQQLRADHEAITAVEESANTSSEQTRQHIAHLITALQDRERVLLADIIRERDRRIALLQDRRRHLSQVLSEVLAGQEFTRRTIASDNVTLLAYNNAVMDMINSISDTSAEAKDTFRAWDLKVSMALAPEMLPSLKQHGQVVPLRDEQCSVGERKARVGEIQGTFVRRFGGEGQAEGFFRGPYGIAMAPESGELFVTDFHNNRIQVFSRDGTYLRKFGDVAQPISYDANGQPIYSHDQQYPQQYGYGQQPPAGTGVGLVQRPVGIAIAGEEVFVSELAGHCIEVFRRADGRFLRKFGEAELMKPFGMAWMNEEIYVVDNNQVQVFRAADGVCVRKFGMMGAADGQLQGPVWVTALDNEVYVTDCGNRRISVFRADGMFLRKYFGGSELPLGKPDGILAVGDQLLIGDRGNHCVHVLRRSDGAFLRRFGSKGLSDGQFQGPYGMAFAEGELYVTDPSGRVQIFN